jgi:hypothetical protein
VERVGLQMPLIHEHRKRGGVHQRHTTGHEPSKGQELRLTYEQLIPLAPRQGVVRADPERLQTLSNTITVKKNSSMHLKN